MYLNTSERGLEYESKFLHQDHVPINLITSQHVACDDEETCIDSAISKGPRLGFCANSYVS